MTDSINWPGKSGARYQYWVYPTSTEFKHEPGNYIYAKVVSGNWVPVYIGQSSDLGSRLANHEKDVEAKRNGATHIHAHTSASEGARLAEERDLIVLWKPICNDQLVA
jgi:hypothetical protein